MITVKERVDYKEMQIDEFSIYDLYSEKQPNKNPSSSPSTVSQRTFRSQYRMDTYIIDDLAAFVKSCIQNEYE